ncbi:hypothetical protein NU08_3778 [Flavobacterium anhuiense]|uniref:Uncharacterized protein n=1 Tax=Flavobacterium anhuiense TaxID=459526 RepID=A0A444VU53_9FLAO|nr:hypothetical protein NU08_3778 [Flavobacterium anhuiense]
MAVLFVVWELIGLKSIGFLTEKGFFGTTVFFDSNSFGAVIVFEEIFGFTFTVAGVRLLTD